MSKSRAGLDPEFAKKIAIFEGKLEDRGIKVILTWGYRSVTEQNKLFAKGRTAPGSIVTSARGGYSWHNYGRAADYAFIINGKVTWNGPWDTFGRIAKECGLEWGGAWKNFKDRPHVQWTGARTLAQMRALSQSKIKT
ncbi:MAG: M15 family metallopeptidase [Armatimonadota bacterium]